MLRQQDGPHGRQLLPLHRHDHRQPGRRSPRHPDPHRSRGGIRRYRRPRPDEGDRVERRGARRGFRRHRHPRRPQGEG